jgi:hypothetical protein
MQRRNQWKSRFAVEICGFHSSENVDSGLLIVTLCGFVGGFQRIGGSLANIYRIAQRNKLQIYSTIFIHIIVGL